MEWLDRFKVLQDGIAQRHHLLRRKFSLATCHQPLAKSDRLSLTGGIRIWKSSRVSRPISLAHWRFFFAISRREAWAQWRRYFRLACDAHSVDSDISILGSSILFFVVQDLLIFALVFFFLFSIFPLFFFDVVIGSRCVITTRIITIFGKCLNDNEIAFFFAREQQISVTRSNSNLK